MKLVLASFIVFNDRSNFATVRLISFDKSVKARVIGFTLAKKILLTMA